MVWATVFFDNDATVWIGTNIYHPTVTLTADTEYPFLFWVMASSLFIFSPFVFVFSCFSEFVFSNFHEVFSHWFLLPKAGEFEVSFLW